MSNIIFNQKNASSVFHIKEERKIHSNFQGYRWRELEEATHREESKTPCNLFPEQLEDDSYIYPTIDVCP